MRKNRFEIVGEKQNENGVQRGSVFVFSFFPRAQPAHLINHQIRRDFSTVREGIMVAESLTLEIGWTWRGSTAMSCNQGCRWFEPSRGSQMKRPCNPNRYGLDARSFLHLKSLYIKDFAAF